MTSTILRSAAVVLGLGAAAGAAQAIGVVDAPSDYVAGFTGSHKGDLDVIGAFVSYNPATDGFVFSGTMNADVGLTPGGFYVWGVNRGAGTAGFKANGIDKVFFDAVVILRPDGTGAVNRIGPNGGSTPLPANTAFTFGSTIVAKIDGSLLPSTGFAKSDYTWNLWPRDGSLAGFAAISDFAPDNSNAAVTVLGAVPEPASMLLMGMGLAALGLMRRRRAV